MNPNMHLYAPCAQFKWIQPKDLVIDDELKKEISRNYRTFPSFEKTVFERKYIKHYSLQSNELLKCRWKQYKDHYEKRVFAPFQFPGNRDLHFCNGSIRFVPAMSVHRFPEYRRKLKPGPGVDFIGQMPIPQELLMHRGGNEKEDKKETKNVTGNKHAHKRR